MVDKRRVSNDRSERYLGFPSFETWQNLCVDEPGWQRALLNLQNAGEAQEQISSMVCSLVHKKACDIWNSYNENFGQTSGFAERPINVEAKYSDEMQIFIEENILSLDFLINRSNNKFTMNEELLKEIHALACYNQIISSSTGNQKPSETNIKKWKYKHKDNFLIRNGCKHYIFCPAVQVNGELSKLMGELISKTFLRSHPVLQASYALFSFLEIHPFQDGNGRVARAIVFFLPVSGEPCADDALGEPRQSGQHGLESEEG